MTTRHLVDPELLPVLESFPLLDLSDAALPLIRERLAAMAAMTPLPDLPVQTREVFIGQDSALRCLLVQPMPLPAAMPAILHFHGGGHVFGLPDMTLAQSMDWAAALGCSVLSVDYRLAPEFPFPAAMDDAYTALGWLHDNAEQLGIDRTRIAVSGESAGGAMAACLCLLARDRGEYAIAFQHLEMPRLNDRLPDPPNPTTGEFVWRAQNSEYCRAAYLAGNPSPYGSAARATDLSRLPPAYIMVGALDLFVDECLDYAARLIRAGVAVEMVVYPGCFHGFRMARDAAVSRRAGEDNLRALRRALMG